MKVCIMNKNTPLVDLEIDLVSGYINDVITVKNIEAMPFSVYTEDCEQFKKNLYEWLKGRSIPASRHGFSDALRTLGMTSMELIEKSFALSLSDQYWLNPISLTNELHWKDINFFTNSFSEDVGNLLLLDSYKANIDLRSPDNTSDGMLRKKWIIENGTRYLLKEGSAGYQQEPFNEKIASLILDKLNAHHAEYDVIYQNNRYMSKSPCFVNENQEFVSAYYVTKAIAVHSKKDDLYRHFLRCIEKLEVPQARDDLDKMLVLDALIMNTDRHFGNFGLIRNVETLKFEGFAPIFDSGNSLWFDLAKIPPYYDQAKPFRTKHSKQVQLVNPLKNFDFNTLANVHILASDILQMNECLPVNRIEMIRTHLQQRFHDLQRIAERYLSSGR